jgi:hypothetical protein
MKLRMAFFLAALVPTLAMAVSKVPECEKKSDLVSEGRPLPSLKALPPLVYVGKSAKYSVEMKSQDGRLQGEQSFVKGESRIACASGQFQKPTSFSMYAPTLIDLTGAKNIGDSYWQFHMTADQKHFGIWNQKSRLFSNSKDLDEGLSKVAPQIQVFQLSHDEYEVIFTRETEQSIEVLSVRFDSVSKIP